MYRKKLLLGIALVGLMVCGFFAYKIYAAIFSPNTSFNNDEAIVFIPTNGSMDTVVERLSPLLKNTAAFTAVAERKGYDSNVKGGRYIIKKGMNNNEIINSLRSANQPVRVSFNNQETLADLAGRIATQIEADSVTLLKAFNDPAFLDENGFDEDTKLAMYLPNTYEFFWNTSAVEFRQRMLQEYKRFWNEERLKKAADQNLDPQEVSALAAIVQKETVKIDERPRVAGVYLNRLKISMPLQADPTVIFAIRKETGVYDTVIKRVLYRDLEIDSPYNTYKNNGLPPGPITMPDISSIEAVLNPEKHNYLYFVVDVSNFGYHKFAATGEQHNQNKVQYIRWLNSKKIRR